MSITDQTAEWRATIGALSRYDLYGDDSSKAADNRIALQRAIDAGPPAREWLFRGGLGNIQPYHFDRTVRITGNGRRWRGLGGSVWTSGNDYSSQLLLRGQDRTTAFNGTTITATSVGGSKILHLTGAVVHAEDEFNSIYISGGLHFQTNQWRTIVAADVNANAWTLDADPTDGQNASAMTGTYCPELIQDAALKTSLTGINFNGIRLNTDTVAARTAYHVLTGSQTNGLPTGKHHLTDCSFNGFDYPILIGPGMAGFGGQSDSWAGVTDNFADNIDLDVTWVQNCKVAYLVRNEQSLLHRVRTIRVQGVSDAVYQFDGGGKLHATGHEISGVVGTQLLLKLGPHSCHGNDGDYTIEGISFDSGGNTASAKLVETNFITGFKSANVTFRSGTLSDPGSWSGDHFEPAIDHPLVDVQSAIRVKVADLQGDAGGSGFWPKSLRLRNGPGDTRLPSVVLDNLPLACTPDPASLFTADSNDGVTVRFVGCQYGSQTWDGLYRKGTGWLNGGVYSP